MKYEELRVQISPGHGGKFRSRVDTSAGSPTEHEFYLPEPMTADELADRNGSVAHGQVGRDTKTRLGQELFKAGLGDKGTRTFLRHQAALESQQGDGEDVGLRLRLVFGGAGGADSTEDALSAARESLPAVALPWEALAEPDADRFFALDRHHSIVRTVGTAAKLRPTKVRGALQVLVVDAAPPELDAEEEIAAIRAQLKEEIHKRQTVAVKILPEASWEATRQELEAGQYHILHFIGHGGFDEKTGKGRLIFRHDDGSDQPIDTHQLWLQLGDLKTLRLIFLNACSSAKTPHQAGRDPMGSVALALSATGVPAVLGMQIFIYDDSAVVFAREFYGRLRQRLPIETAVAEGRKAIAEESAEWATPVLHLRGESSDLFMVSAAGPRKRDDERWLRLGIRSFIESKRRPDLEIWAKNMKESTDSLLALEEFFAERFLRPAASWSVDVLPRLNEFLRQSVKTGQPLLFDFAAHSTLAFATGFFLQSKGGIPNAVVQRGIDGTETWLRDDGEVPPGPIWQPPKTVFADGPGHDLALAIEVSNPVATKVSEYLKREKISVRQLVRFSITDEPGQDRVQSGAHAFALAQKVSNWLLDQPGNNPNRKVHLFWSGPNTFAFFLGRLAQGFGKVQLYEFDFEGQRHATYEPSLELPVVLNREDTA